MLGASIAIVFSLAAATAAQTTSPDLIVLKNESLQLTFTRDGRLAGFTPTLSKDNYLKAANQPPPLVEVTLGNADGSGQIKAYPLSPRVSISNGTALIESDLVRSSAGDIPIEIRVSVRLVTGSAESRWTVKIGNRDPQRTVFAVTLPRMSGICLGPSSTDDELYFPTGEANDFRMPSKISPTSPKSVSHRSKWAAAGLPSKTGTTFMS